MTRWTDFVKQWAKDNNTTYGCAMSEPKMKEEYYKKYPKQTKEQKKEDEEKILLRTLKTSTVNFREKFVKPYLKDKDGVLFNDMINKYRKFSQRLKDFIKEKTPKIHEIVSKPAQAKDERQIKKGLQKPKKEPKKEEPKPKKTEPKKESNKKQVDKKPEDPKTEKEIINELIKFNKKNLGFRDFKNDLLRSKNWEGNLERILENRMIIDNYDIPKNFDEFKKGKGMKNRKFNIIQLFQKLMFSRNINKNKVLEFIDFMNNETNRTEKLYIAVEITKLFKGFCNKVEQMEDIIKIAEKGSNEDFSFIKEKLKLTEKSCLNIMDYIEIIKEKFNISDKQIKDNMIRIF